MSTNLGLYDSHLEHAPSAPSTVAATLISSIDDVSSLKTRTTTATTVGTASSANSHTPASSSSGHSHWPGSSRKAKSAQAINKTNSSSTSLATNNSEQQRRPSHELPDHFPDTNVIIVGAGGKKRIISSSLQASLEPSPHAIKPQARDAGVSRLPTFRSSSAQPPAQMRPAGFSIKRKQPAYVSTVGALDMDDSFVVGAGTSARPGSRMAAADLQSWLAHSPFYNSQQAAQMSIAGPNMALGGHKFPAPPSTLPPFADSASKLDYSFARRASSHASSDWQEEILDDGSVPSSHASGSIAEPAWDDASMVDDGRSIAGGVAGSVDFQNIAGGTWGSSASRQEMKSSLAGPSLSNELDPTMASRSLREIRRNLESSIAGSHVSASPQVSPMQAPSPQMHFYAPTEEEEPFQHIKQQSRSAIRPSTSASMTSQSSTPHDFEIAALRAQVEQLSKALMKRSESDHQVRQVSLPHLQQQQDYQQRRYVLPASPSTLTATSTPTGKSSALPAPSWQDGTNATSLSSRETTDAANKIDDLAKKIGEHIPPQP